MRMGEVIVSCRKCRNSGRSHQTYYTKFGWPGQILRGRLTEVTLLSEQQRDTPSDIDSDGFKPPYSGVELQNFTCS